MDDGEAIALALLAAAVAAITLLWPSVGQAALPPQPSPQPGANPGDGSMTFPASVAAGGSAPARLSLSPAGAAFIKRQENAALFEATNPATVVTAYPDANGYSIAYGYFGVQAGSTMTKAQADALFPSKVLFAVAAVRSLVRVNLTQGQFDALVDFVYNEGRTEFAGSQLLALLNSGNYAAAAADFSNFTRVGSQHSTVLADRRAAEQAMFEG
jgi:lysozyme